MTRDLNPHEPFIFIFVLSSAACKSYMLHITTYIYVYNMYCRAVYHYHYHRAHEYAYENENNSKLKETVESDRQIKS